MHLAHSYLCATSGHIAAIHCVSSPSPLGCHPDLESLLFSLRKNMDLPQGDKTILLPCFVPECCRGTSGKRRGLVVRKARCNTRDSSIFHIRSDLKKRIYIYEASGCETLTFFLEIAVGPELEIAG